MTKFKQIVKAGGKLIRDNSNHILTGLGVAGVVSTAVMTGRASIKAYKVIEAYEDAALEVTKPDGTLLIGQEEFDEYSKNIWVGRTKLVWKHFLPPVIMGSVSIACIIGANTVNGKQKAALASLYTLTETTLKDYREKVIEQIGENKEEKIRAEVAQKKLDEHPVSEKDIILTGKGEHLCYDSVSGRYFKSDIEKIRRIQNELNEARLDGTMWTAINDFYYLLGLEPVSIGEELGWTVDDKIEFIFTSKIATNGEPCLVISYEIGPRGLERMIP